MRSIVLGLVSVLAVSGCASMSKEECLTADWQAIGYEDGAAGRPVSAVSERRAVCAKKANVTVDMAAYTAGRREGLTLYCEPSNGYAVGSHGGAYYGVCAGPDERDFLAAYETGRQLYVLQSEVASINAQIHKAHNDLRAVEHTIADTEIAIISPGYTPKERIQLLADLRQLSEDKGSIETAIIALNRDQVRAADALADYRDELAYNGGWQGVVRPTNAGY